MSAITADDILVLDGYLPADDIEFLSVPPDGASWDGSRATRGLPLETAGRPDVETGTEAERWRIPALEVVPAHFAGVAPMHVGVDGLHMIESFEGFSSKRYLDPVGVPTIGYGTTSSVVFPLPATCTRAQAEGWLRLYVQQACEPAIRSTGCPLNEHQFDALCSFVYNLGPGSMSGSWTIGRDLRARNYRAAADAMLMYDRAGGVVLAGLVRRRQAERALFLEPVPAPDPHRLSRFPAQTWTLNGRHIPDRGSMEAWFRTLAGPTNAARSARLRELQRDIVLLRKRDWAVAHWDHPASWATAWRGWRWQQYQDASSVHIH